mgnify:FL=1
MSELKKHTTTINEKARQLLRITRDEYALCSYIHYRAADSRQKFSGWCCDSKEEIAEFIDITRPGLYKMADRLQEKNLLELGPMGAFRTTAQWIDAEQNCKQSLQLKPEKTVNKVDTDCKLSLQPTVNKVNESIIINVELDKSKKEEEEISAASGPSEDSYFKAEEEKKAPPVAPPPPAPGPPPAAPFARVDITQEIDRLRTDDMVRENFSRGRRIPPDRFDTYVSDFTLDVQSRQEVYWSVKDFRSHFFNWCEKHYKIEKDKAGAAMPGAGKSSLIKGTRIL